MVCQIAVGSSINHYSYDKNILPILKHKYLNTLANIRHKMLLAPRGTLLHYMRHHWYAFSFLPWKIYQLWCYIMICKKPILLAYLEYSTIWMGNRQTFKIGGYIYKSQDSPNIFFCQGILRCTWRHTYKFSAREAKKWGLEIWIVKWKNLIEHQ